MNKRVYISGPMAGRPALNEAQFRMAAELVKAAGDIPEVPHDILAHVHTGPCPPAYAKGPDHSAACYLRTDLQVLLECDEILMITGWEASVGARLELNVAAHVGMPVRYV